MLKKILIFIFALTCLLTLTAAGLVWYLYKNQNVLAQYVLAELNDMQQGHTKLRDIKIDPISNFPYISVDLKGLALYPNQKDTLKPIYRFDDVYLGFNYTDIISGNYKIKKIKIRNGEINIEKYEDGSINLLLAKSFKQKAEESEKKQDNKFTFKLKQIVLRDLKITKKDFQSKQFLHLHFKRAASSFKFSDEYLFNHLDTNFELVELNINDSVWFKNKELHWETDFDYHFQKNLLTIRPSNFEIKDAQFQLNGSIDFSRNAFLDLEVYGKKPDFKLITAFAPEGVYEKLKSYQNKGEVYFKGKVVGESIDNIPKIDLEFGCKNADFINPNRRNSIRDLNFTGFFTNGSQRNLKTSELYIKSLSGNPEESVFKGSFHIKNFEDPFISLDFHSRLNLATLQNFFEIEELKGLSGWLTIDMTLDELMDYNDTPTALGKLKDGTDSRLVFEKVRFNSPKLPFPILFDGKMEIVEGKLVLNEFLAKFGKSDFKLQGEITNLARFFHNQEGDISADLKGSSQFISFKELTSFDKKLSEQQTEEITDLKYHFAFQTTCTQLRKAQGIPEGEFWVKDFSAKLKNYPHHIHDWHIDLLINNDKIAIKQFEGFVDDSDFKLSGYLNHYLALMDSTKINDDFELKMVLQSKHLNFDDLFIYKGKNYMPEEYRNESIDNLLLDFTLKMSAQSALNADFFKDTRLNLRKLDGIFKVHNYGLRNVGLDLITQNGSLSLKNFKGQLGKTDFKINADIENVAKVMAGNFKGKKSVQIIANQIDMNQIMQKANLEQEHDTIKTTEEHAKAFNIFDLPFPNLDLQADIGYFRYGKYQLKNLKTALRIQPDHFVYVDKLQMNTAGGLVDIKGYFNGSNPKKIYFQSTINVADLDMDKIFYKMDNFGQDYLVNENMHGKITGTITSKVLMHPDLVVNLRDTEAHIEATLKDGRLTNFAPFKMMDRFMAGKDLENVRFGEMQNVFDVKNGEISIPRMEISSTLGYMKISGKQNFDNDMRMSYLVEVPSFIIRDALWNHLSKRRRERRSRELAERRANEQEEEIISSEDRQSRRLATVLVEGTPDKIDFDFKGFRRNRKE